MNRKLTTTLAITATVITLALIAWALWRMANKIKNLRQMEVKQPTQPIVGTVTSPFGPRKAPTAGASTSHNGVDVSADKGTPILAPWDGMVLQTWNNSKGGKQLTIVHTNLYRTGYAHLSGYNVRQGQKVKQGDIIAYVGNTGASTGAHLHFTLTDIDGGKIDPLKIFTFKA